MKNLMSQAKQNENTISFFVPGDPKPQERPRVTAYINPATGRAAARVYERRGPAKDYKSKVSYFAMKEMEDRSPFRGPVSVILKFYITKPKSIPKYKQFPDTRPDLDNYVKAVTDALTSIIYIDDKQICGLQAYKMYAIATNPGTSIEVRALQER